MGGNNTPNEAGLSTGWRLARTSNLLQTVKRLLCAARGRIWEGVNQPSKINDLQWLTFKFGRTVL